MLRRDAIKLTHIPQKAAILKISLVAIFVSFMSLKWVGLAINRLLNVSQVSKKNKAISALYFYYFEETCKNASKRPYTREGQGGSFLGII
jgi:hypothetical protein